METEILVDAESGIKNTGVLDPDKLTTTAYTLESVKVDQIQQIDCIRDYRDRSDFLCPILVKDPTGYWLLDGQNYIDEANSVGIDEVTCFIYHVESHDAIELGLRKYAIRLKPQGGSPKYPEIIRNTRDVIKLLEADGIELKSYYSHGGSRKGVTFSGNVEDDIRIVLMNRTGKSRTSINDYINYGDLVNDVVMDKLVVGIPVADGTDDSKNKPASKDFFKSIQPQKRDWILAHKISMSGEEIEKAASEKVWAAFLQDHTGKKVTIFKDDTPQAAASSKKKAHTEPEAKGEGTNGNDTPKDSTSTQDNVNHKDNTDQQGERAEHGDDVPPGDSAGSATTPGHDQAHAADSPQYVRTLKGLVVKLDQVASADTDLVKLTSELEDIISGLMAVLTEVRSVAEMNDRLAA